MECLPQVIFGRKPRQVITAVSDGAIAAVQAGKYIEELETDNGKYDIIIVGAGASGVFMSYELTRLPNKARVLMIDKGSDLTARTCPIKSGRVQNCIRCNPCHIMNGYGGAAAFLMENII